MFTAERVAGKRASRSHSTWWSCIRDPGLVRGDRSGRAGGGAGDDPGTQPGASGSLSRSAFFFTVACVFVLLEAEFLAALQVLVYIGAVAILLMFGIMLTRNIQGDDPNSDAVGVEASRAPGRAAHLRGTRVRYQHSASNRQSEILGDHGYPSPDCPGQRGRACQTGLLPSTTWRKVVGRELMTRYMIAFEVAGLLLTAALVGAIAIAHREEIEPKAGFRPARSQAGQAPPGTARSALRLARAPSIRKTVNYAHRKAEDRGVIRIGDVRLKPDLLERNDEHRHPTHLVSLLRGRLIRDRSGGRAWCAAMRSRC